MFCYLCRNRGGSPLLFKFPLDPFLWGSWMRAVGFSYFTPVNCPQMFLCSIHFEEGFVYRDRNGYYRLYESAIPTKFLPAPMERSPPRCVTRQDSGPPPLIPIEEPIPAPDRSVFEEFNDEMRLELPLDRLQYLFDNPLLLQDLVLREKSRTEDDQDLVIPQDRNDQSSNDQLMSLRRFHHLCSVARRIHIRLAVKVVLVIRSEDLCQLSDITVDPRDSDRIPPCYSDLLQALESDSYEDKYAFLHFNEYFQCWQLIGCMAPFYNPSTSPVSPIPSALPDNCEDTTPPTVVQRPVNVVQPLEALPPASPEDDPCFHEKSVDKNAKCDLPSSPPPLEPLCPRSDKESNSNVLADPKQVASLNGTSLDQNSHFRNGEPNTEKNCASPDKGAGRFCLDLPTKCKMSRKNCSFCNKEFSDRDLLKAHEFAHDPTKWLCCTFQNCNYMTKWRSSLCFHVRRKHSNVETNKNPDDEPGKKKKRKVSQDSPDPLVGPAQCTVCLEVFADHLSLSRHQLLQLHFPPDFVRCQFCDHVSLKSGQMATHVRSYHADKLAAISSSSSRNAGQQIAQKSS